MARGTRFDRSAYVSGTTIATILSGVTIDANGIDNGSSIYPVGFTYSGCSVSGGSSAWAGTTISINHTMLNDLKGFSACQYLPAGISVNQIQISQPSPAPGSVSLALVTMEQLGGTSTARSGGTIYWMAFGK